MLTLTRSELEGHLMVETEVLADKAIQDFSVAGNWEAFKTAYLNLASTIVLLDKLPAADPDAE
jgi:hypothetical protein